jgi:parallel beta-helix repeat protein
MAGASSTVSSNLSNQRIENAIRVENDGAPAVEWNKTHGGIRVGSEQSDVKIRLDDLKGESSKNYTLSGSTSPGDSFSVDDDITVKLNGETVFIDNNGQAGAIPPIHFEAFTEDLLTITLINTMWCCLGVSNIYLHWDTEYKKLINCFGATQDDPEAILGVFFNETFVIGDVFVPPIHVPDDFNTIQDAIDNALGGQQIVVSPGNYSERVTIRKTDISLTGSKDVVLDGTVWLTLASYKVNVTGFAIQNSSNAIIIRGNSNNILENSLKNSSVGVRVWGASYMTLYPSQNLFYHNNVIGNDLQILCDMAGSNSWDDSYPPGGNYWSDYNGTDLYNGQFQNETGIDGIGDTPYIVDSSNQDNYPLMRPYVPFENQTIHIRADGSVDPSGAPVLRKGDLYVLTGNITSSAAGIVIERDNMTLGGAGYALQGEGEYTTGIDLSGRTNVTLQNLRVEAFGYGIVLYFSSDNTISGNNITANGIGILLLESSVNTLSENNITSNGSGMGIDYSSNHNTISGNNITANTGVGLELCASSYNKLMGNAIADNWVDFFVSESSSDGVLSDFVNDVDTSNTVDGKPVYYWIDRWDMTVPSDAGYVALVNCTRITVQNLDLTRNGQSLLLAYSTNSVVIENSIGDVALYFSSDNNISENDIKPTFLEGIYLHSSSNNNISENNITTYGAYDNGVSLEYCSNNTISGNNVTNCYLGIWVLESSNNMVYHNNFINNSQQVQVYSSSNAWDNGYPSGGNYWSGYTGVDLYSGPYQNETGSDGIGDKPYIIDVNNADKYPLMKPYPWGPRDVGVTYIARVYKFDLFHVYVFPPKTIGFVGISLHLDVFVMNYGDYPEVLNLTVYANSTVVGQVSNVTLSAKNSTILDVRWDTSGFAMGNYTISAYLAPVSGETDIKDNNYTDGNIKITIPGDVNGDGKVNIEDIAYVAKRFGMRPTNPGWDPNADLTDEGKIDITDVATAAKHFGEHYS